MLKKTFLLGNLALLTCTDIAFGFDFGTLQPIFTNNKASYVDFGDAKHSNTKIPYAAIVKIEVLTTKSPQLTPRNSFNTKSVPIRRRTELFSNSSSSPYLVSPKSVKVMVCTGTFIAYNKVLTAGHCTYDFDHTLNHSAPQNQQVLQRSLVSLDYFRSHTIPMYIKSVSTFRKDAPVTNVQKTEIPYENYKITNEEGSKSYHVTNVVTFYDNDFAVLTVDNTDTNVTVAKLAPDSITRDSIISTGTPLMASGYGLDKGKIDFNKEHRLQNGSLTPTSDQYAQETTREANQYFESVGLISPYAPLMYSGENFIPTCSRQSSNHGDSGGPVFLEDKDNVYLVGTIDWGLQIVSDSFGHQELFSYNACIDKNGRREDDSRLSVITDFTKGSTNRISLENLLKKDSIKT